MSRTLLVTIAMIATSHVVYSQLSSVSVTPAIPAGSRITWADLDTDGDMDIISTNAATITLYGNVAGIFNSVWSATIAAIPQNIQIIDFDRDGDTDILFQAGSNLVVLDNQGLLAFSQKTVIGPLDQAEDVGSWIDIDGDGDLDAYIISGYISYCYYNNGNGTFKKKQSHLLSTLKKVRWADLNSDGLPDFFGISLYTGGAIFINKGEGHFVRQSLLAPTISESANVDWFDPDADGDLDLIATDVVANQIIIYKNKTVESGALKFTNAYKLPLVSRLFLMTDISQDGKPDMILASRNNGALTYIKNISTKDSLMFDTNNPVDFLKSFSATDIDYTILEKANTFSTISLLNASGQLYTTKVTSSITPLPAPVNLSVSHSNVVEISWQGAVATGQFEFKIELIRNGTYFLTTDNRDLDIASNTKLFVAVSGSKMKYNNLPVGHYEWKVRLIGAAGQLSPWSAPGPSFDVGPVVTGLSTTTTELGSTQLKWSNTPEAATSFRIFRLSPFSPPAEIATVPGNTLVYEDNYRVHENYSYAVQAEYNGAYGQRSPFVAITQLPQYQETGLPTGIPNELGPFRAVVDFDNDNDYDILAPNDGYIKALLNDGAGNLPGAVAIGPKFLGLSQIVDIDSDGDEDIAGSLNAQLQIYKNVNGTFTLSFAFPQFDRLDKFMLADFNNDGLVDILLQDPDYYRDYTSEVKIYQQDRSGNFLPLVTVFPKDLALRPVIADFDNDSFLDLFFPFQEHSSVNLESRFFRNLHGQGFEQVASTNLKLSAANAFDCDYDGYLDLLGTISDGYYEGSTRMGYLKGNGDFTFSAPDIQGAYSTGLQYNRFRLVDIDLNGLYDIFVEFSNAVVLYNGIEPGKLNRTRTFSGKSSVILWDRENDGDGDMIFPPENIFATASFWKNNIASPDIKNSAPSVPTGLTFTFKGQSPAVSWNESTDDLTPAKGITYNIKLTTAAGALVISPRANDSGGFHRILDAGNAGTNNIYVMPNLEPGEYKFYVQALDASFAPSLFSAPITFTVLAGPTDVTVKRLRLNACSLSWKSTTAQHTSVLLQRAKNNGAFETIASLPAGVNTYEDLDLEFDTMYSYMLFATYNGTPTQNSNVVTYNTSLFRLTPTYFGQDANAFDVVDLNGDNKMDFFLFGWKDVMNSENRPGTIWMNTATGFASQKAGSELIYLQPGLTVIDLNNDFKPDYVATGRKSWLDNVTTTEVFINDGTGKFTTGKTAYVDAGSKFSYLWDFDADADADIVAINPSSQVQVYRNDGGTIYTPVSLAAHVTGSLAGDFNNDGTIDLFQPVQTGLKLFTNINKTLIATSIALPNYEKLASAVDIDGDGDLDVSFLNKNYELVVYENNLAPNGTNPTFSLKFTLPKSYYDSRIGWADLDHDGDMDLYRGSEKITVYINEKGMFRSSLTSEFLVNGTAGLFCKVIDFDNDGDLDIQIQTDDDWPTYIVENLLNVGSSLTNSNSAPPPPSGITASITATSETGTVDLTWTAPNDDRSGTSLTYDVILYKDNKPVTSGFLDPATGFRYRNSSGQYQSKAKLILPLGSYQVRVQAIDQSFLGSTLSEPIALEVKLPPPVVTGIEASNPESLAFPNPASTFLYFNLKGNTDSPTILISDARGTAVAKVITGTSEHTVAISVSSLTPGLYFYSILYTDGSSEHGKIVKE